MSLEEPAAAAVASVTFETKPVPVSGVGLRCSDVQPADELLAGLGAAVNVKSAQENDVAVSFDTSGG